MKRGASFRKLVGPAILFNVFRGELAQRSDGRYTHPRRGRRIAGSSGSVTRPRGRRVRRACARAEAFDDRTVLVSQRL